MRHRSNVPREFLSNVDAMKFDPQDCIDWDNEPFTFKQVNHVKRCLEEIRLDREGVLTVDAAWLRILTAARAYQDALQHKVLLKKPSAR